jgi:hypothetical protein
MTGEVDAIVYEVRIRNDVRRAMMSTLSPRGESVPAAAAFEVFATTGYDMMGFRKDHREARAAAIAEAEAEVARARRRDEEEVEAAAMDNNIVVLVEDDDYVEHVAGEEPVIEDEVRYVQPEAHWEAELERITEQKWEEQCEEEGLAPAFEQLPVTRKLCIVPRFVAAMTVVLRAKRGRLTFSEANRLLIERDYLMYCRQGGVRFADIVHHSQWVYNSYFGEGVYDEIPTARVRVPAWMRALLPQPVVTAPTIC